MRLYLDTCCWGRWNDYQGDAQVRRETNAISEIIDWRHINGHIIIGSPIVTAELLKNTDIDARNADLRFFSTTVDRHVRPTAADLTRARGFQAMGLKEMDSYHLAVAESAGVDVLLTVDQKFFKRATSNNLSRVKVINPLTFIGG